ncbi:MAG: tRNA (N6-threonylcarbamoyladenosine(37)-N6)-methyltransferase TrmO [Lachnospiraceae bacterium]|nr:tRNA (N6-threonylcarbamoyladenosine(37)-N6)-methyltransferase TrmO [Lachnospiraceae bacterium]
MSDILQIRPIARIHSDLPEKFGIPRQSGLVPSLSASVVFEPAFADADAVRGLENFSHIWLIWEFSGAGESRKLTVRPPRLGGNERVGVFATRSPFRPNPLGLSCVRLTKIEYDPEKGPVLRVAGADLMDGTPIYDIKPYLPYADCISDAWGSLPEADTRRLQVNFPEELAGKLPEEKRQAALGILEQDPRPAYHDDPERIYGVSFAGHNIRFRVKNDVLTVTEVDCL